MVWIFLLFSGRHIKKMELSRSSLRCLSLKGVTLVARQSRIHAVTGKETNFMEGFDHGLF